MSNIGPFVKKANPETLPDKNDGSPSTPDSANAESAGPKAGRKSYPEVQSAKRFPIKLPISVKSKTGERHTETQNISANGVLFQMVDSEMPIGSMVDFTISLPAVISLIGQRPQRPSLHSKQHVTHYIHVNP